jgi:hypothetical protein
VALDPQSTPSPALGNRFPVVRSSAFAKDAKQLASKYPEKKSIAIAFMDFAIPFFSFF